MKLPRDIGPIHFVGIGGIGMSGIAEVLANQNYRVRGSDVAESANVQRLRERGIEVAIGHDGKNLGDAAVVVVSSAIKRDNPELVEARKNIVAALGFQQDHVRGRRGAVSLDGRRHAAHLNLEMSLVQPPVFAGGLHSRGGLNRFAKCLNGHARCWRDVLIGSG